MGTDAAVETANAIKGIPHPTVILIFRQPNHRRLAMRGQLMGGIGALVRASVASVMIGMRSAQTPVEAILCPRTGKSVAAVYATAVEHAAGLAGTRANFGLPFLSGRGCDRSFSFGWSR